MRGSPLEQVAKHVLRGSIPARAGEPWKALSRFPRSRVYPRPCGGALINRYVAVRFTGLSPPVRGSRSSGGWTHGRARSIPARAGEPRSWPRCWTRRRVYPRPCGGAIHIATVDQINHGLSPPVRGSLSHGFRKGLRARSIPARAGEPVSMASELRLAMVYPRPCGGAGVVSRQVAGLPGLSPPVRGSLTIGGTKGGRERSIPARAGEPHPCISQYRTVGVYPRPCGGAMSTVTKEWAVCGLSPPVRGSRIRRDRPDGGRRSIPARAGEPLATPT